ncbi:MAG TPA: GNAT family N-acetyltransferase [Solirubrobacteraceae bacterium]
MPVGAISLRDGTPVVVRPIDPADRPLLVAGFEGLSERSRYQRFFRVVEHLRDDEVDFFVNVDHDQHEALAATTPDGARGLGIARYIRLAPTSTAAEIAIVIVDEAQGLGLGHVLVDELAALARAHGVGRFVAQTGVANRPFRRLMERLGRTRTLDVEGSTIELETEL